MTSIGRIAGAAYGLPETIPSGLANQCSAVIDAYLKRPEGLLYTADANGNPTYMTNATVKATFTIQRAVTAGANVVVTGKPALMRQDLVGEVLILDRLNASAVEACVIVAVGGNNQCTLANVQFAHNANCTAEAGLVITEKKYLPSERQYTRVSRTPIANLMSLYGTYGYGRRSDQIAGFYGEEATLLALSNVFGGPPQWVPAPLADTAWNPESGEIWVPAGVGLIKRDTPL